MANVLTLVSKIILPHQVQWNFSCLLSGSYVSSNNTIGTPGETLNFNAALNPYKLGRPKIPAGPPAARLPTAQQCEVTNTINGFAGIVEPNATLPTPANFVLRLYTSGGTEMTAQAYSSSGALLLTEPFLIQITAPLRYN